MEVTSTNRVVTDKIKNLKEDFKMKNPITFDKFHSLMHGGESRLTPGKVVTYVLVEDSDGEEVYYTEWDFVNEDNDLDMIKEAYQEYLDTL